MVARGQLPVCRPDLPTRQPAAHRGAQAGARQAPAAGPLGHHPRAEPPLRAPEPGHQELGPGHDLHRRAGARRPRPRRERLPGGHLHRAVPVGHRQRGRDAAAVPAVLLPRRHPLPRRAGDARLDSRGRRARVLASARLRRGVRQPGPDRRLRDRRRRVGDRAAGGLLALQQVPQPGYRWRGAADPAPQRVQDRQPDRAGPHPARRADRAADRLRLPRLLGGRRRPPARARVPGGGA